VRIGNDMRELARVATLVEDFGARHDFPDSVVVALNVSLDEILNNIISYAYDDAGRHDIVVRLELRGEAVEVLVEDDGKPFDPLAAAAPEDSAGDAVLGGVGLHFVRSLMDRLEYTRRDGLNRLRLVKKLRE
jgi:anti-sigma regulatory factor (Ser/Thr protein kinase)